MIITFWPAIGRVVLLFSVFASGVALAYANDLQDGDIIFHRSEGRQAVAIALSTHSDFTHMGIIFFDEGVPYVYEAVQPVKRTPLAQWIKRGKDGRYVVRRVKNLDQSKLPQLRKEISRMLGKDYDTTFDWSDTRFYCSELVWKAFHRVYNMELGELRQLKDFDLDHEIVRRMMRERYGKAIPTEMKVISPSDMFHSTHLMTVVEN